MRAAPLDDVGVHYMRTGVVNVSFISAGTHWVLVDTGLPGFRGAIVREAERTFGRGSRPAAIVLTHGHFDHSSNARALADQWSVPVYAHRLEMPFLSGASAYAPTDPAVGGGVLAWLSSLYPLGPINLGRRLVELPPTGDIHELPGWTWLHTPGHSPGHISLFRERDRVLVAGDAVITVRQESLVAVLTQRTEMHGPPAYFTIDWAHAEESVQMLAALEPEHLLPGHGRPLAGEPMRHALRQLARNFDRIAVPRRGRYIYAPAIADGDGIVEVPPPVRSTLPGPLLTVGLLVAAIAAIAVTRLRRRSYSRAQLVESTAQ